MTPEEAITTAGSKGKWNVNKHIAAKAVRLYASNVLDDAIKLIRHDIKKQEEQVAHVIGSLSALQMVSVAAQVHGIEMKIKGMKQTLFHLTSLYERENKS
jgi:hypothetical protein